MKKYIRSNVFLLLISYCIPSVHAFAQQTVVQYLTGTDKDHTVNWDFMVTKGRKSGSWSTIPVPSCWEMQGFGSYNYYEDKQNPDEQGFYKHVFKIAQQHKAKKVWIVFDGVMTDAEVKINGKPAGTVHQGGFYQFKYDITGSIRFEQDNLLEVNVSKKSSNNSINRAERQSDFWLFGGIFRPVYLEILPATFIERVAIDAKANGDFTMQVYSNKIGNQTIEAQLFDVKGKTVDKPIQLMKGDSILRHHFSNIKQWNSEQPVLYNVVISIKEENKTIHTFKQRFGFRIVELREQDGLYVNGTKVIFKGVCRHSEWPETGRTLSRAVHLLDILTMKGMNMNAVRMSHYPPDKEFLDLCDSMGLYVINELTGWQKAYDTTTSIKLVKELVIRDVNHPSVVIWANGNEGGWNRSVDSHYALYDPQKRLVIHPWERFNGTNTKHYPNFEYVQKEVANAKEVFFPTEFMHGLFDGGHGAALEDFWNEMMKHPHFAGGFLWALHDEGVVRADKHDSIDVAGNLAPDGIVGPHREKEGSYFTIKELWSPVYIETKKAGKNFTGTIEVENKYLYTNLDKIKFEWKFISLAQAFEKSMKVKVLQKGFAKTNSVEPGNKGMISIPIPPDNDADVFYLAAMDLKGDTVCTWSWAMRNPAEKNKSALNVQKVATLTVKEEQQTILITCDAITYHFDKMSGYLKKVVKGKKEISLSGGPSLGGRDQSLQKIRHLRVGEQYFLEPIYDNDSLVVKWIFQSGKLPKLEYSYKTKDTTDYMGITFNYPETKILGIKWMGRGPYRVWKNRMKGQQLGVWEKAYNNTITGENWKYPEFKGWHSELYWMQLQNSENDFIVYTDQTDIFLQILKPEKPKAAGNNNTSPPFPDGTLGFMHGISAIGTKFNRPEVMGPQSEKHVRKNNIPFTGVLYFDFR